MNSLFCFALHAVSASRIILSLCQPMSLFTFTLPILFSISPGGNERVAAWALAAYQDEFTTTRQVILDPAFKLLTGRD